MRKARLPFWIACILFTASAIAPAPACAQKDGRDNTCAFDIPKGWEKQPIAWIGGCKNARAEGYGALNRFENDEIVETFYGRVEGGSLSLGVIEGKTGAIAGRFKNGTPERDDGDDTEKNAYEAASRAARELADLYARKGDKVSAQSYKDQARKFLDRAE